MFNKLPRRARAVALMTPVVAVVLALLIRNGSPFPSNAASGHLSTPAVAAAAPAAAALPPATEPATTTTSVPPTTTLPPVAPAPPPAPVVPSGKGMAGIALAENRCVSTCNLKDDKTGQVRPGAKAVDATAAVAIPVHDGEGKVRAVVGIAWAGTKELTDGELVELQVKAGTLR